MDEKIVQKKSLYIFLCLMPLFLLIGIVTKSVTYPIGYLIGYIIDLVNFKLTIKMTDAILSTGRSVIIIILMNVAKYVLFALALGSGILLKDYVNIFTVLIGLLTTKFTIYIVNYLVQKGEVK